MSSGPPKIQPYRGEVDPRRLPVRAIRDLLGVVRVLYARRQRDGASQAELTRIADTGRTLASALGILDMPFGDSVGDARRLVEDACSGLVALVRGTPAAPLVAAACARAMAPVMLDARGSRRAALGRR